MALHFSSAISLPHQKLSDKKQGLAYDVFAVLGASVIIALCAPLAVPLPFTPVPLALQPSMVLLFGALLGSKRGALAVLSYLAQGAAGLPVFAMGKAGALVLVGPTGGYLLGYVAAAFLAGFVMERSKEFTLGRAFLAMGAGKIAIYAFGMAWLSRFIGLQSAFVLGVLPFVVGDVLKTVLLLKGVQFFGRKG